MQRTAFTTDNPHTNARVGVVVAVRVVQAVAP